MINISHLRNLLKKFLLGGYLADENSVQAYLFCLYLFRVMTRADFQLFVSTIFCMMETLALNELICLAMLIAINSKDNLSGYILRWIHQVVKLLTVSRFHLTVTIKRSILEHPCFL